MFIDLISTTLNSDKFIVGSMMILMNIGGRFISHDLSIVQEEILSRPWIRRLFIFVFAWYATRDVAISIVITLFFIIIINTLFNDKSRFCILPQKIIDNNNTTITQRDYNIAINIIKKYNKQNDIPTITI